MKTETILPILHVGAWIVYIGAIIRSVMLAVVFVLGNISGEDEFYSNHFWPAISIFSLLWAITILHVQVWEKVKDILTEINLGNPFTMLTAQRLVNTGYLLLAIWIVSFIGKNYLHYLHKSLEGTSEFMQGFSYSQAGFDADGVYLLNAGIVYIIAQVFRRGVELQQENELTI